MTQLKVGRSFYYLELDGSLRRHHVPRQPGSRHPNRKTLLDANLVVAFDYDGSRLKTAIQGVRFTDHLFRLAFLQEFSIQPSTGNEDLGPLVPPEVRSEVSRRLRELSQRAQAQVVRNWDNVGKENDLVALLVPLFNETFFSGEVDVGDWSIDIRPQIFSDQAKEPIVGADLGWIVQIRVGRDRRTTKALWMQAKKTPYDVPSVAALMDLKGFEKQYKDMRQCTAEAYGLVFTQDRVVVGNDTEILTLEGVLDDMVRCERGDQNETVLAQTVDRYFVSVDIVCAQARLARPPSIRRQRRRPDPRREVPPAMKGP